MAARGLWCPRSAEAFPWLCALSTDAACHVLGLALAPLKQAVLNSRVTALIPCFCNEYLNY